MIPFDIFSFHTVIDLPSDYEVYDFSLGYDPDRPRKNLYGIGKYREKRPNMYTSELFSGTRDIHMGIDIAAPIGTAIHAFYAGEIFLMGNNSKAGDYGFTLITKHVLNNTELYALHGHLSARSLSGKKIAQKFSAGEILAWIGDKTENGGWNPHLHFQLSYVRPEICDMPGAVSSDQLQESLAIYPDPQLVLGKLY